MVGLIMSWSGVELLNVDYEELYSLSYSFEGQSNQGERKLCHRKSNDYGANGQPPYWIPAKCFG